MVYHGRQYDIGFNSKKWIEVTNKLILSLFIMEKIRRKISLNGLMKYGVQTLSLPIEMMLNSVIYARISCELDESLDHKFRSYKDQEKGNENLELENDEALDQEDDYVTNSGSDQ